jgi:hypothetical protein
VEVPVEVTKIVEVPAEAVPAEVGPVTLEVYDPTGSTQVITELFAPRLDTLEGKTICEVSNGYWQANRTFPLIQELLQKQFPTAKIIPDTEFPRVGAFGDVPGLEDAVKAKGCDAVIVGNAG